MERSSLQRTWTGRLIRPTNDVVAAPLLRRSFTLDQQHGRVIRATIVLTALGTFSGWLNARPLSPDLLEPGWSSYEWHLPYVEYDVTTHIQNDNALVIALGNGWYRGRLGWVGRSALYGDKLAVIADLTIEFEDGHHQVIGTDESWRASSSHILANDLYDGQITDARAIAADSLLPGFDDSHWDGTSTVSYSGVLTPRRKPPVRAWAEIHPRSHRITADGNIQVDFGQNLVGWVRIRIRGPRGSELRVRHAEVLEDGHLALRPLRSAKAEDRHILSGGNDVFEPSMTFHGFRYIEIEGWPGAFDPAALEAVAIGSNISRTGTLTTSNPLLNRLHENVVWSLRGNFLSAPTDCPQRDERLGWTGDISVFAPTAAFLFDVEDFLTDWLCDLAAEQSDRNGIVPYVVPDILKYHEGLIELPMGEAVAIWSDAAVWVPWALHEAYGGTEILAEQYDSMTSHVRHVRNLLTPDGLWEAGFQFADWLDPDAPPAQPGRAKAHPGVVATACAFRSASLMARTSELLGHSHDFLEFSSLADQIQAAFNRHYVVDGLILSDCATVYALAIEFGILDEEAKSCAGQRLADIAAQAEFRITTGFAGTPFVASALTSTGHTETAYSLLLCQDSPSWLAPVTMGATTIWERWDSLLANGQVNPGEMTSFNHYALGSIANWMHRIIGGISPLSPGYAEVLIAPIPGGGLTHAECTLESRHGPISVRWLLRGTEFTVDVDLGGDISGILRLPGCADRTIGAGRTTASTDWLQ